MEESDGAAHRPCPWPGREELWAQLQIIASGPRTQRPLMVMSDAEYEDIARRCGVDTADFCRRINQIALEMRAESDAFQAKLREQWARIDRGFEKFRKQCERNDRRACSRARRSADKSGNEDRGSWPAVLAPG